MLYYYSKAGNGKSSNNIKKVYPPKNSYCTPKAVLRGIAGADGGAERLQKLPDFTNGIAFSLRVLIRFLTAP